jgi:hypothetical protein
MPEYLKKALNLLRFLISNKERTTDAHGDEGVRMLAHAVNVLPEGRVGGVKALAGGQLGEGVEYPDMHAGLGGGLGLLEEDCDQVGELLGAAAVW